MFVTDPHPRDHPLDPWRIELIVVAFSSHSSGERRAISRDVARGLLVRVGRGAYVEATAWEALTPEDRHIVRVRAHASTSPGPVVFSHWSAAVLLGLPVLRTRLERLHVTTDDDDERHRVGVAHHLFPLHGQLVGVAGLWATTPERTVVDIAGAARLEEGVITADAALRTGVLRSALEEAAALVGLRRASRRIAETIAFAHPAAESAAESRMRVTSFRIGVEAPELQHRIRLADGGSAFLDAYYRSADAGLEVDGDVKYLDAAMAPRGAGIAVLAEKRREDEVRLALTALARIGWRQSGDASLLRPVLARIGVFARPHPASFDDYCAVARAARPRPFIVARAVPGARRG